MPVKSLTKLGGENSFAFWYADALVKTLHAVWAPIVNAAVNAAVAQAEIATATVELKTTVAGQTILALKTTKAAAITVMAK